MKAAILCDDRDVRLGDAADPRVGPDEVLIAPSFAGICGTDLHVYRGEFHGRVEYPAILGHEFGGIIQEIGEGVAGSTVQEFKAGDRVVVDPIISCHSCPACLSPLRYPSYWIDGYINACRTLKLLGIDLDGGFGQYVAAPADQVYRLPDEIPMEPLRFPLHWMEPLHFPLHRMEHASMVEMYGLGHHILQRGGVQPGESVAIPGGGQAGAVDPRRPVPQRRRCHDDRHRPAAVPPGDGAQAGRGLHDQYRGGGPGRAGGGTMPSRMEITQGQGVDCAIEAVGHYHVVEGQEAPRPRRSR